MHRLSNVNARERTAHCAHCGPVRIIKGKSHTGWRCYEAHLANIKAALVRKRARRKVAIQLFKTMVGCERCDAIPVAEALHLHHPNGDGDEFAKRGGSRQATRYDLSRAGFVAELLRCEVLCANCHRAEHASPPAPDAE